MHKQMISLTDIQVAWLRHKAKRHRISVSEANRRCIDACIDSDNEQFDKKLGRAPSIATMDGRVAKVECETRK